MAKYPGATQRPLPNRRNRNGTKRSAMAAHNILCFHTMAGFLAGTESTFTNKPLVDSHFGVGGPADGAKDGVVWQWVDTATRSGANVDGNPEVVSIETSDGNVNPTPKWSDKQLDALVKLGAWVCLTHKIPPVLINGTKPGTRGIGYHRQGVVRSASHEAKGWPLDQWKVKGGVQWSGSVGKVCPGNARIKQLVEIVIPRIKAEVEGKEKEWWEMPIPESELRKIAKAVRDINADPNDPSGNSLGVFIRSSFNSANQSKHGVARIEQAFSLLADDEAKLTKVINDAVSKVNTANKAVVKAAVAEALREVMNP